MAKVKQGIRENRQRRYVKRYKRSIILITMIMLVFVMIVSVSGANLWMKKQNYVAQEAELQMQIEKEQMRTADLEALAAKIGTTKYIENIAREKLGLVYKNEIVFRAQE